MIRIKQIFNLHKKKKNNINDLKLYVFNIKG